MDSIEQHIEVDKEILDNPLTSPNQRRHIEGELHELEDYVEHHQKEIEAGDHHDGTVFCGVATLTQNQSGYDSLAIPTFNSTKRNLMSGYGNLPKGAIMYNTTTNKLNFWNGSAWEAVTSST